MCSDLTLPIDDGLLNVRVGAIIQQNDKFLMVSNDTVGYCYSVGGRIRFAETAEEAVIREVAEETGATMETDRLGFIHETFFFNDGKNNYGMLVQEISFYFYMRTPEDFSPVCKSVTNLGSAERLVWISPEDDILCYPLFFKTELKTRGESVKHIVTDERIGLPRGTVKLARHQQLWETEAQSTIKELKEIFGKKAPDIQHVGSTSIPSIMAKPIIDIAVAVNSFHDAIDLIPALELHGYYYRPHNDLQGQLLFAKGSYYRGDGNMQTHFIHVVNAASREWIDYINFRDYLNTHPEDARAYEALKLRLAMENQIDGGRKQYLEGKKTFILEILQKAAAWRIGAQD